MIKWIIILLVTGVTADLVTTLMWVNKYGIEHEANPMMIWIWNNAGIAGWCLMKYIPLVIACFLIWKFSKKVRWLNYSVIPIIGILFCTSGISIGVLTT